MGSCYEQTLPCKLGRLLTFKHMASAVDSQRQQMTTDAEVQRADAEELWAVAMTSKHVVQGSYTSFPCELDIFACCHATPSA